LNPFRFYKEIFRRFAWVRFLTFASIIALGFLVIILANMSVNKKPVIDLVNPSVGSPGDVMLITGENFGSSRNSSYVEIAGSRLTSSGYLDWSDTEIKVLLPANVQDGLVIVGTSAGRSKPGFFANASGIPIASHTSPRTTLPSLRSITPQRASIGQTITITGSNFGESRGNSQVLFTASREEDATNYEAQYIPASTYDFDYESWTDTEIRVHVPDGAMTGSVYVQTEKGISQTQKLTVETNAGQKGLTGKRTYVLQVDAEISNAVSAQGSTITLYVPRPPLSASQPSVEMTDCTPEALISDDPFNIIQKKALPNSITAKQRFTHTFVVTTYTVTNNIKRDAIPARFSDTTRLLFQKYTAADALVPANDPRITELLKKIVGEETSRYRRAVTIYNYMLSHYRIQEELRVGNVSPLDMLETYRGDAYDFAIVFTALCRAAGVPTVPIGGILIESDSTCRPHWWAELYFEGYGWFPADVAIGAGLQYKPFAQVDSVPAYYWGNLDSQHVAFSRGWTQIRTSEPNGKTVYRPRTYALQSIWEEASSGTASYSSLWTNPIVKGIY